MISDSVPWRYELFAISVRLRRRSHQKRWTERTYYLVERDVMVGAYSIRRLIDSNKSSTKLPGRRIPVIRYARTGRVPMPLDRSDLTTFYDIENGRRSELDVATLCNQIIHSFIMQMWTEDDGSTTVGFASDRARSSNLYSVALDSLADLFDYVGREDVVMYHGQMIGGVQMSERTSNHDLVESGQANYVDDQRVITDWHPPERAGWEVFEQD